VLQSRLSLRCSKKFSDNNRNLARTERLVQPVKSIPRLQVVGPMQGNGCDPCEHVTSLVRSGLVWVNRVGLVFGCKLPVYAYEPTYSGTTSTEAMAHKLT